MAKSYDFYEIANQPIQPPEPVPMVGPQEAYYSESQISFGTLNINPSWTTQMYEGWAEVGNMGFDVLNQAAEIEYDKRIEKRKKAEKRMQMFAKLAASGQFDIQLGGSMGTTDVRDWFGDTWEPEGLF